MMKLLLLVQCLFIGLFVPGILHAEQVLTEPWLSRFTEAPALSDPGRRAEFFSRSFLNTPYRSDTLGGGAAQSEKLTVNLDEVDCFTLLDYVEALRRSAAPKQFRSNLVRVRYRDGQVSWRTRRHFFSDWSETRWLHDVTGEIGGQKVRTAIKNLNRKKSGAMILPGVDVHRRIITWLPQAVLVEDVFAKMKTGDYIGVYSDENGLDVSHVGLVVRKGNALLLRHASNQPGIMRVVDVPLPEYLADKPGMIVLRPVMP